MLLSLTLKLKHPSKVTNILVNTSKLFAKRTLLYLHFLQLFELLLGNFVQVSLQLFDLLFHGCHITSVIPVAEL